ncbi:MAG: hypothetical protein Q7S13_02615 [Candidatus Omnitrophota bacterium]|nr:hypothetical protein [Candidatus Omnitrophota bacterium]
MNYELRTNETPRCSVYGQCGGCSYQDLSYTDELQLKEQSLRELFEKSLGVSAKKIAPILASPRTYHYRHRLDLKMQRTQHGVFVGFNPRIGKGIVPIDTCPVAREEIASLIPSLTQQALQRLPSHYLQANLVVRCGQEGNVHWGGIGKKSIHLEPKDYLWVEIQGRKIFYSLDTFFQANLFILPAVIDMIRRFSCWTPTTVFYDLYGGVGLFGLAMIDRVKKVVLIENEIASVRLAQFNKDYHQLPNFDIIQGKVGVHLDQVLDDEPQAEKIAFLDPPRAGLSQDVLDVLIRRPVFKKILYLSCNPSSLVNDLTKLLKHGGTIETIVPMDFFPRTKHLETLVVINV